MAYTNIDSPKKYFEAKTYTGTGSSQSIGGLSFSPDFTWIKRRDAANGHLLQDSVRGATNVLFSHSTSAEVSGGTYFTSFNSDGFTVTTDAASNASGGTYTSWNWDANGTGVSNNSGSITSTVSANTTSGFSIVSYTGTGSNATVGHSLGTAPSMVIVKNRSAVEDWTIYHSALGNTKFMDFTTGASQTSSTIWNNTSPTSTLFTVGTNSKVNGNTNNMIAYCFAEVKGFSKFGSYTGNGSTDGTFVYTGFKPAMIWTKQRDISNPWNVLDNKRATYNVVQPYLAQNNAGAESSVDYVDFLSNGFKLRYAGATPNASGDTIIYIAFAENPFVSSKGIPTTAR